MDPTPPAARRPLPPAGLAAAIAAGAFALYARTAAFPFVLFDDPNYVSEHARVLEGLTWSNVAWALTTFHFANWHPLTWLSYLLDATLLGARPGAMHLVNAGLHAANAALVFAVLHRLTGARWRSAMAAALFALHPTRVESVAWISERKDLLFTLFGLLAILAYERYARRPSAGRFAWVALAFAASLMSKSMLVTLPFLLLLLDVWPLARIADPLVASLSWHERAPLPQVTWRRALLEKLPLLALSAGCAALTVAAQSGAQALVPLPPGERLANALVGYVRHLGLAAWPTGLAPFYPLPQGGYPAWQVVGAAGLLAAGCAAAWLLLRRAPWIALGWCWFLGTLVPAIGVVQVGWQALADRYGYFPLIGLFVAAVWSADAFTRGAARRALAPAAALLLLALVALSWVQLGRWGDEIELFRHTIAVTGSNGRAHELLALALGRAGRPAEALGHAREGALLSPRDERAHFILGVTARDAGAPVEAELALREAIALRPDYPEAWAHLGGLLADLGRFDESAAALRTHLALEPTDADAWTLLAVVLDRIGRTAEALAAFEAGAAAAPRDPRALRNLGTAQLRAGDPAAARATADRLAPLDPQGAGELRRRADGR